MGCKSCETILFPRDEAAETIYSCGHSVFFLAVHNRKHFDPDDCPECRCR